MVEHMAKKWPAWHPVEELATIEAGFCFRKVYPTRNETVVQDLGE